MSEEARNGEASGEGQVDIAEAAQRVAEFTSKLDGVDMFVAVAEGFPIAHSGIEQDKVDDAAALAVDIAISSEVALENIIGRKSREVIVVLGEGRVVHVVKARELLMLLQGLRQAVDDAAVAAVEYIEGRPAKCPHCGHELQLEVYKCHSCGRRIPFRSNACPHCGAPTRYKPCPRCGNLVTSDGKRVKLAKTGEATVFVATEAVIGAAVAGAAVWLATSNPLAGVLAGALGAGAAGVLAYKLAPSRYVEE